jgi:formylglycine-generating enzyme required for sulfatase activity
LSFPSYGWDNEYGERTYEIEEFKISETLISNGQFWFFLKDNGYAEKKYWTEDGWSWRTFRNVKWPTFWVRDGPQGLHQYKLRTIFEIIEMQWDWPAVVNYYEAKAYCNWLSEKQGLQRGFYRLGTELEHHAIRDSKYSLKTERDVPLDFDGLNIVEKAGINA